MGISGDKAKAACRAMKRGDLLFFLESLNDATIAAWELENEDQDETIVSYIDTIKQEAVAQVARAAAAQLQATQAAHAAGVNVKKEGSATSIIFRTVDAAELLKLVESEFGAGGRLKTNDGSVVGKNSPLERGATFIWHPPAGGEYDCLSNVAGTGGGTRDVNHHASTCTHAPLAYAQQHHMLSVYLLQASSMQGHGQLADQHTRCACFTA
ncbi:hypothetical protein V8C86DRAFT_1113411 [Haematococcus lacustris]